MTDALPLERILDLADVPDAGYDARISASVDELRRLAEWAGVDAVTRLDGEVHVDRQSRTRFRIETTFEADIVQTSVVSLEPVCSRIVRAFERILHLSPGLHRFADKGGLVAPASADDGVPEKIESSRYDLAAPLREELALAIDPYPRAPGETFEPPSDADMPDSPFAVLKDLDGNR